MANAESVHLALLKVDLGLRKLTEEQTAYLNSLVDAAKLKIAEEGITLDAARTDDDMLVVMYAAWMYRSRAKDPDQQKMPRMLRWQLNCRLTSEKMAVSE